MTGMKIMVMIRLRRLLPLVLLSCSLVGCAIPGTAPGNGGAMSGADGKSVLSSEALFALSAKADIAYRGQRWPEAASHYQQLTEAVPKDAWSWFRLGNVRTQQGQYEAAIQAYSVSIGREGKAAKPWFNLSTVYLLNARKALLQAAQFLASDDPAHVSISSRIDAIDAAVVSASVDVSTTSLEQNEASGVVFDAPVEQFAESASGWTPAGTGLSER
ncbi:tetratricopeptide repeat protein [Granulosicoccus antarcticus]|nr:tetratricopeptide repeat protein [Granulosicoccus antarcticus]